jgi:eukaryotic-like serine/threonine-protein kinase
MVQHYDYDFRASQSAGDPATADFVPSGPTLRPNVTLVPPGRTGTPSDLPRHLHKRLRFVTLGASAMLAYFCLLTLLNPWQKVGFSLERGSLIACTWLAFLICVALSVLLWRRTTFGLWRLRLVELVLFGTLLSMLVLSLGADLFLDHELRTPWAEGDHALFHYASSWSLPFFALIICYGTLIPSTWQRCVRVVATMAVVPLSVSLAAGLAEGIFNQSFIQSFLLQMALWLGAGSAIAIYGAHRLQALQHEVSQARQLGQYRLKERLGSGGMGEVYLAEHALLRRPCALKVIREEFARDPRALHRFEHEVQMTATLTHPNTVQVYDYGHAEDGTFYYVMEYLPGLNLEQVVNRDGPLPVRQVLRILRQMCGALREAHGVGLIHRDLKPSNIILCERGGVTNVAKLLDFGLVLSAETAPDTPSPTGRRVTAGSPRYMSPEQATGRADLDHRTDIYSLGAVGYFLLTGQPPFVRGTVVETLKAHHRDAVVPPRRLRPGLPTDVETVVLRCLAKAPNDRYADMNALEAALRACVRPHQG